MAKIIIIHILLTHIYIIYTPFISFKLSITIVFLIASIRISVVFVSLSRHDYISIYLRLFIFHKIWFLTFFIIRIFVSVSLSGSLSIDLSLITSSHLNLNKKYENSYMILWINNHILEHNSIYQFYYKF